MAQLEITAVEAYPLREPVSRRAYTVLKVRTSSGLAGYGECREIPPSELKGAQALVVGQEATAHERIRRQLAGCPAAQAGINIALLDLVGKLTRAPVYQLLGGPTRAKARALARLSGTSDDALAASLAAVRSAGFHAALVPALAPTARNQGQAYAQTTRRRMESLRKAAPGMDFVLDGASSLTPGDASSLAAELERFHLLWFDEPCPLTSLDAVRKISSESVTPLGFGRTVESGSRYQDLLRENIADILRPDLARHGISHIRRIAALAETYYMAVAPYHDGGPVGTAAALHLAASLPNFFIQQIPVPDAEEDRHMRAELTGGRSVETVQDGYAALPSGPGLGIEINEQALMKYAERAA